MAALGWTPARPRSPVRSEVGRFTKRLDRQFLATCVFVWVREGPDSAAVVARVGIDYGPAQDLLVAFAGSPVSGTVLREPVELISVHGSADLPSVASRLVQLPAGHTAELARKANVDMLIEMLRDGRAVPFAEKMLAAYAGEIAHAAPGTARYPDGESELIPALLAGAGRYDDARLSLERSSTRHECGELRQRRRFCRQVTRYIDAKGTLALPITPPRWPLSSVDYDHADAPSSRAGAMTPVRSSDATASHLEERAPADTIRVFFKRVACIRAAISSGPHEGILNRDRHRTDKGDVNVSRARRSAQMPDNAAYPLIGPADHWVSVALVPDTTQSLALAWQSSRLTFGRTREVVVWLSYENTQPAPPTLAVHIGALQVARLSATASACFQPVMAAAAERDESPWTRARLTKTSSSDRFQLALPLPGPAE